MPAYITTVIFLQRIMMAVLIWLKAHNQLILYISTSGVPWSSNAGICHDQRALRALPLTLVALLPVNLHFLMSSIATKRLNKELKELLDPEKGPPVGIKVLNTDDLKVWVSKCHPRRERISDRYPMESPEVVFVVNEEYQAPIHPHVYSNGHICASILGSEWSPVLNTSSLISLYTGSMGKSDAEEGKASEVAAWMWRQPDYQSQRPVDNDRYVRSAPLSPKQTRFHYDEIPQNPRSQNWVTDLET
ncbi:ubiquitin-conjugating enzyme domain-containing protein [Rhizoctonia solani AG-1 IA]|uniref:Ubiquitin-conjugating enzyme domain-containing protein n=1 Tax=Thanatephorus cucumeris (strain AG1-IA) TaxID=983506 RepID=L8X2H0_THACA|nr:ubiquitin-conjugating enzyme domain-containing protein [Rhizoctonia solani AG-1 IA]